MVVNCQDIAEFIAKSLKPICPVVFSVTGGGALFLNRAFHDVYGEKVIYLHDEQSCAIAAETYYRVSGRPAVVCVTSGPGSINALNGVFGAYTDSIPMIVISGQVRTDWLLSHHGLVGRLRQLGDQEVVTDSFGFCVKRHCSLSSAAQVPFAVADLVDTMLSGRKGPVWLSVPIDLQSRAIDPSAYADGLGNMPFKDSVCFSRILDLIAASSRPVMVFGSGCRSIDSLKYQADLGDLGIAVTPAWTALDLVDHNHPLFIPQFGPVGTKAGNVLISSADLIVIVGSRLPVRQISYNVASFAENATVVYVDVDSEELAKPYLDDVVDLRVRASAQLFLSSIVKSIGAVDVERRGAWRDNIASVRELFPNTEGLHQDLSGYNPYAFVEALWAHLSHNEVIVCADASASVVPFQIAKLRPGQKMFTNAGSASMGYELPGAVGALVAVDGSSRHVTCLAGDGSMMMNLQELASFDKPVDIIIFSNNGYSSILQSQNRFFNEHFGCSPQSRLPLPNFDMLAHAFGFKYFRAAKTSEVSEFYEKSSRADKNILEVMLDPSSQFLPKSVAFRDENGVMHSPQLKYVGCDSDTDKLRVDQVIECIIAGEVL